MLKCEFSKQKKVQIKKNIVRVKFFFNMIDWFTKKEYKKVLRLLENGLYKKRNSKQ